MYVVLHKRKKKLFYKNKMSLHMFKLLNIKNGKPIYRLKIFFEKPTKSIYRL